MISIVNLNNSMLKTPCPFPWFYLFAAFHIFHGEAGSSPGAARRCCRPISQVLSVPGGSQVCSNHSAQGYIGYRGGWYGEACGHI